MPSKQTHDDDVIAIEELVHEIKQNLRLKAAPPATIIPTTASVVNSVHHHPLLHHSPATTNNNHNNSNLNHNEQPKNALQHPPQQQQHQPHQNHQLVIKKQRSRPSPYHIPCRSWNDHHHSMSKQRNLQKSSSCQNDENNIEDPYELLQSLLKNNSLVKEAVRRLQINNSYSRKQNNYFYYDSDEDNRSPIVMMCQLES